MQKDVWIEHHKRFNMCKPVAVVGAPGLRSIGILVTDYLMKDCKPELFAELYSTHFPIVYQTKPIYASHPSLPGVGGISIASGIAGFPSVQFYYHTAPPVIFTRGYHANFHGQYDVAEKVLDFFEETQVTRIIVIAGYGWKGKEVCCAATSQGVLEGLKQKHRLEIGYEGPFYGFSGLVFGLAKRRGIEALCLFGRTEPDLADPKKPDEEVARMLAKKVAEIVKLE